MSKTVFLGVEGSGKTTLTMALARAFESHKSEGWYLKPLSRDSFRFLKTLPETLDGNFPSQTADLRELRWQAEYKGHDLGEIAILDYPGEIYRLAFLDEKDERDPEAFRQKVASNKPEIDALLGAIKEAEDVFVLFNLADGMDLRNNPRNLDTVWVTNECLKLLKRLESKPRIRLLFTQVDRYRDAGLDLSSFSPKSIDLIGHDHSDIPYSLVSSIDPSESEYGIDKIVIGDLLNCAENTTVNESSKGLQYIFGVPPLRHLHFKNARCLCFGYVPRCIALLGIIVSVVALVICGVRLETEHSICRSCENTIEECKRLPKRYYDEEYQKELRDRMSRHDKKVERYETGVLISWVLIWLFSGGLIIMLARNKILNSQNRALELFQCEQWKPAMRHVRDVFCVINPYLSYYISMVYLFDLDGKGLKYAKARQYLIRAKHLCEAEVLTALGYMAEHGFDQPVNKQLARQLYSEASACDAKCL